MKTVVHKLIGYSRSTDRIEFEQKVPPRSLEAVKAAAGVGTQDRAAVGSYPLNRMQARDVAGHIGCRLPNPNLDYFLEAFSEPAQPKAHGKRAFA
jgi:hypothetical protein